MLYRYMSEGLIPCLVGDWKFHKEIYHCKEITFACFLENYAVPEFFGRVADDVDNAEYIHDAEITRATLASPIGQAPSYKGERVEIAIKKETK